MVVMIIPRADGVLGLAGHRTMVVGRRPDVPNHSELEGCFEERKRMMGAASLETRTEEPEWR